MEVAVAASAEPRPSAPSVMTYIRFLPNMSPSRPMIGVVTEAARR